MTALSIPLIGRRSVVVLVLAISVGGCATPASRMCRVAGNVGLAGTECNGYGQCIVPCVNIPGYCNAQPNSSECQYCNANPSSPDCRFRF
jgi:hypothetical protein